MDFKSAWDGWAFWLAMNPALATSMGLVSLLLVAWVF